MYLIKAARMFGSPDMATSALMFLNVSRSGARSIQPGSIAVRRMNTVLV
jgi:hypothetical protein